MLFRSGYLAFTGNGRFNTTSGNGAFTGSGNCNTTIAGYAFTGSGFNNTTASCLGTILNGQNNRVCSQSLGGAVLGGTGNIVNSCCGVPSHIGGGAMNYIGNSTTYSAYCVANGNCLYLNGDQTANFNIGDEILFYNTCDKVAFANTITCSTYSGGYTEIIGNYFGANGNTSGSARNLTTSFTSGFGQVIGGGLGNTSSGCFSSTINGTCNTTSGTYAFTGNGRFNTTSGDFA